MLTLNHLIETRPDLRLRWAHPAHASTYGETHVAEVTAVVPARQTGHDISSQHLPVSGGGLALVTWGHPPGGHSARKLCDLIADLRLHNAAGLVLRTLQSSVARSPQVQAQAEEFKLPVLTTDADSEWVGVNHFIQQQRAAVAERHVERLEDLMLRLPARVQNSRAARDIITWLSSALDADVALGSHERGVLVAAPGDRTNRALHLVTRTQAGSAASAQHTRAIGVFGGDTLVLGVASHRPFGAPEVRLMRHAAKFLGFFEQVGRGHRDTVLEPRRVSQAAAQLLLGTGPTKAQLVAHALAPSLAETEQVRVRILDTGRHDREATLRWCEDNLSGRALVTPCPETASQIVIVTSARHDASVDADLRALVRERGWLVMGASRSHDMESGARAHAEAAQALQHAARVVGRISTGAQPKLAPLLPRPTAHAWAVNLLEPVLGHPAQQQLLDTLRIGCSFRPAEASRGLGIHRNTLRQRLARANRVLGLDLNTANDRILVLLALDILSLPDAPPAVSGSVRDLDDLLAYEAEAVRSWAEIRLSPLRSGQRDLENTLCVWLEHDLSARRTATALGVSEATVRHHIHDATELLGMDVEARTTDMHDTSRMTIADVGVAAYVLLGRPQLRRPAPPLALSSACSRI
ncbi:helix-turn-helix domain-containing protein [Streptomyces sp. NPDC050788]|uniref:helix-turn-helix domain-containing protein n=1 Tax=Streptomyces sp. NPDC050788 TaxID=3155041 RepID=UPI00342DC001